MVNTQAKTNLSSRRKVREGLISDMLVPYAAPIANETHAAVMRPLSRGRKVPALMANALVPSVKNNRATERVYPSVAVLGRSRTKASAFLPPITNVLSSVAADDLINDARLEADEMLVVKNQVLPSRVVGATVNEAVNLMVPDKGVPDKGVPRKKGRKAGVAVDIVPLLPSSPSTDSVHGQFTSGNHPIGGKGAIPLLAPVASLPPSRPEILALVELQKKRVFCIKSQSRCDRSVEAFIARYLGYQNELDAADRVALFKRAAAIRRSVEKGGHEKDNTQMTVAPRASGDSHLVDDNHNSRAIFACTPIILTSAMSRSSWDNLRDQAEKEMRKLAATLPVYLWVKAIKGFGDLGLAIIVGEAGDIGNYATKERLWKRLGLAVIEGERQQRRSDKEQAAAHGYNPRRRAEIWTLGDSLFRHQWRGAKDDQPAGPSGPYGVIYQTRKDYTANREGWTLGHRENDARRIMMKRLLEDLHREWHKNAD